MAIEFDRCKPTRPGTIALQRSPCTDLFPYIFPTLSPVYSTGHDGSMCDANQCGSMCDQISYISRGEFFSVSTYFMTSNQPHRAIEDPIRQQGESHIFSTGSLIAIRLSGQISSSFNLIRKVSNLFNFLQPQLTYAFQQPSMNLWASEFSRKYLQDCTVHIGQTMKFGQDMPCKNTLECCFQHTAGHYCVRDVTLLPQHTTTVKLISRAFLGRSRKNECPQCNATFVALTQFTIIRESWYSMKCEIYF